MSIESINSGPVPVRIRTVRGAGSPRMMVVVDDQLEWRFLADPLRSRGFGVARAPALKVVL